MDEENQKSPMKKVVMLAVAVFLIGGLVYAFAHHNSPMSEEIEENENFDNMDQHEEAIDDVSDNSSMDTSTDEDMGGTREDTSTQDGSTDGADGDTAQNRVR